jgi:hypothetical protein
MGRLYYGTGSDAIEIPDLPLAYLRALATTKLRRSESFSVSWRHGEGDAGRSTIWLHCAIPLRFEFDSCDSQPLDRKHLEQMAMAANTSAGVMLELSEDQPDLTLEARREQAAGIARARLGRAA